MSIKQTRRDFIKKGCQAASILAAGKVVAPFINSLISAEESKVSVDLAVVRGNPEDAASAAFDLLGGIETYIKPNATVLLKPNVSFPALPERGCTTNPQVVKAVAKLALEAGAKRVIVADHTMSHGERCFKITGLQAALEDMGKVKIILLDSETFFANTLVPNGRALKEVKITKLLQRCDVVINLPCAKSHTATDVSFGLKNLMGLIWDRVYFHSGTDLHTAIAELATVIRPQLTIMDATRALTTNGPTGPGKVQKFDTLIAGTDPLAVDSYTTTLTNWNNRSITAQSVKHLAHASTLNIGKLDLKDVNIKKMTV